MTEGPGRGTRPEKMEGTGAGVVLWAEVTGAVGTEGVRITVGFGVAGWGAGNTDRAALGALIPAPVAAADTEGWFTALTGDTAGTGVTAGVEGLEP